MATLAKTEKLLTGTDSRGRTVTVTRCPVGLYLAGAGTRHQSRESYLCSTAHSDGATHGRHYTELTGAVAHFERVTNNGGES